MASALPRQPLLTSIAFLAWAWSLVPDVALAHPLLDEARAQADEAEFQQALLTLARAESESALTREDLVALYLQRALVHYALQLPGAMLADLERVAALEPDLELDAQIPPDVRDAFPRGEPLTLRLRPEARDGSVRIDASVEGLRTDMVRDVVLGGRVNDGEWQAGRSELELPAGPGDRVQYHGAAYGPGGAQLASQGTRDAPLSLVVPEPPPAAGSTATTKKSSSNESEGSATWWVVGGATAAVAAAVIVLLAAGGESDHTQIAGPEVVR